MDNDNLKAERKKVLALFGMNQGLHWFSLGIIIPVLTLTLLDRNFNLALIGSAMALMALTVILLELPTGGLADALGRKKVYMISVFFSIGGYSIILFANTFIHLAIVTILMGTGRALSSGTMDAWFVDEHGKLGGDDRELQKDLARIGIIIPGALGAGTLAGGFLPDLAGPWFSSNTALGTYGPNLLLIITLYIIQIILTGFLIREDRTDFSGSLLSGFRAFPTIISSAIKYGLTRRNTLAILLATAALGTGLAGLEQLWQPRVRELSPDTGIWIMGILAAGYFLAAAAGSAVSTIALKLFGYKYRILLFTFRLVMGALYILLSFTLSLGGFAPLYLILFFAHGITESPEMTFFNRLIPSERRSTLLSLNSLFLQAGGGLGALAGGQIATRVSIPAAWWITGGVLSLSAFFYFLIREDLKNSPGRRR